MRIVEVPKPGGPEALVLSERALPSPAVSGGQKAPHSVDRTRVFPSAGQRGYPKVDWHPLGSKALWAR